MLTARNAFTTSQGKARPLPANVVALPRLMTKYEEEVYWAARIDAVTAAWNEYYAQFPERTVRPSRTATIIPFAPRSSATSSATIGGA